MVDHVNWMKNIPGSIPGICRDVKAGVKYQVWETSLPKIMERCDKRRE